MTPPPDALSTFLAPPSDRGNLDHLVEGIRDGHANAVLAASIFHFGTYTVRQAKEHMARAGLAVRLDSANGSA